MTKRYIWIYFFVFLLPLSSYADGDNYEGRYAVEACEPASDKKSKKCVTLDYVVKVDYRKRIVAMSFYHQGEFKGNTILQGCDFFDAQNWQCSDNTGSVSYANGALLMQFKSAGVTIKITQLK